MVSKIYTVYDSKIEAYNTPFCMRTKGEAIRGWTEAVNDPKTQFNKTPADFTLFEIGEYDDQTATIVNYDAKISIGNALEFIRKSEQGEASSYTDSIKAAMMNYEKKQQPHLKELS